MQKAICPTWVKKTIVLLWLATVGITCRAQCISDTIKINCGNSLLLFERQRYDTGQHLAFIHVHENETTALQAAFWLLDSIRQGCVTTWKSQQQRFIDFSVGSKNFHFDPNRIYTEAGIRLTLGPDAPDTVISIVQAVADTFLFNYILNKQVIVALHNNTDAGGLSIKSYTAGGTYFKDAFATYTNPRQDADDFFYTTEDKYFRFLKSKGYNVVLQNNEQVTDDGSLSVYCAKHGIRYINIEAQYGHLMQQQQMLILVWELLNAEARHFLNPNSTLEEN